MSVSILSPWCYVVDIKFYLNSPHLSCYSPYYSGHNHQIVTHELNQQKLWSYPTPGSFIHSFSFSVIHLILRSLQLDRSRGDGVTQGGKRDKDLTSIVLVVILLPLKPFVKIQLLACELYCFPLIVTQHRLYKMLRIQWQCLCIIYWLNEQLSYDISVGLLFVTNRSMKIWKLKTAGPWTWREREGGDCDERA